MSNSFIFTVLVVFLFCSNSPVRGTEAHKGELEINKIYNGLNVLYVIDGDSLVLKKGKSRFEIRLWGIDSPEHDQPHSNDSKNRLEQMVKDRKIKIHVKDLDIYGRYVVIATSENFTVNRELVAGGAAWVHRYYCDESVCEEWFDLEKRAFRNRIGLWRYENPIEPWVWKQAK